MNLAPLEMSVPGGDGLILKGTPTYPDNYAGAAFPLVVLAHQYPATRDSYSPLVDDLIPNLRAVATVGAAGAPAISSDAPGRMRAALERTKVPCFLASSREDPFDGGANVTAWSRGLPHVAGRIIPGAAHPMAIYFDIRDELLRFLRQSLDMQ